MEILTLGLSFYVISRSLTLKNLNLIFLLQVVIPLNQRVKKNEKFKIKKNDLSIDFVNLKFILFIGKSLLYVVILV